MRGDGAMAAVEIAYRLDVDDESWLREIASTVGGALGDPGLVRSAAIVRTHDDGFTHELRTFLPFDNDFVAAVDRMEAMVPRRINVRKYRKTVCETATDLARGNGLAGGFATILIGYHLGPWGLRDVVQVQGAVVEDLSVCVTAGLRSPRAISPRVRHTWERVGVHLAAGLRLRRGLREPKAALARAGLVLERSGEVAHASPELASDGSLRDRLRECARAVDHARGALASDAPERALDLWRGLFDGRWSILEVCDSDGRAYVVACENEPIIAETRALTRRERQVLELAAHGHSDELIAYSIGISLSTVQTHLQRALAKTGLGSRASLVRAAAALRHAAGRAR